MALFKGESGDKKLEEGKDLDIVQSGAKIYSLYTPLDGSPNVFIRGVYQPLIEVEIVKGLNGYEVKGYKVNPEFKEIANAMSEIANNNLIHITQTYLDSLNKK